MFELSGRSVEIDAHCCVRGMATACGGHVLRCRGTGQPAQPIGAIVRKPVKRRKLRSCDASRRPCLIASAASSQDDVTAISSFSPASETRADRGRDVIPQQRCLYRC